MHAFFWWNYCQKNFLFEGFNISSVIVFITTCIGLLLLSLFFEWLKMLQAKVRQKRIFTTQRQLRNICPGENDNLLANNPEPSTSTETPIPPPFILSKKDKFIYFMYDIGIWLTQNMLGYVLMLAVMIFNGYMVIAIMTGSIFGYFIFGPTIIKINIANCRAMRGTFCMADCVEPDKTALLGENIATEGQTPPLCHQLPSTSENIVNSLDNSSNAASTCKIISESNNKQSS